MRECVTRSAITANGAAKVVPATVLLCVVLTSGALFGMAAQAALDHYGLNLASVRDDLIVPQSRSALAWWAWWLAAIVAFFVGPSSAAATRYLVANWWLLRGLRLVLSGALLLGLAAIAHLPAAPSTFAARTDTAVGAAVALMSAVLAALGARSVRAARRKRTGLPGLDDGRSRDFDPVPAPRPRRGGGSIDSGLVAPRLRPGHALVPGFRRRGRLARAGLLTLLVLAAVSALSDAAVVLELVTPGAIRQLLARNAAPAVGRPVHTVSAPEMQAPPTQTRVMAFAPLPAGEVARPHIAIVPTIAESELTFAKRYAR